MTKNQAIQDMIRCFADAGEVLDWTEAEEILENEICFGEAEKISDTDEP